MGILEKIKEIEDQMAKTQKNKATEHHLGVLKAKLAKLKKEQLSGSGSGKSGGGGGFSIKKAGNATVAFIGLPSVGKSTLLSALTGAKSKVAAYAFTTVTCIPGILHYKGAQIQLLDLPGIIADARSGRGRGREVMNVARTADLVLLVVDVFDPHYALNLKQELRGLGIRMDERPPDIVIEPVSRGGLNIAFTCPQSELNKKTVQSVLNEYGIFNGSVTIRQDATVDQLIDVLSGNRVYNSSLVVVNKVDLAKKGQLDGLDFDSICISAQKNENVEALKEAIFQKLQLIRVYTKTRFKKTDLNEPMMMRTGATIADFCDLVHRDMRHFFKYAQIWGPSAKHPGQKVGLSHHLLDGDIVQLYKR